MDLLTLELRRFPDGRSTPAIVAMSCGVALFSGLGGFLGRPALVALSVGGVMLASAAMVWWSSRPVRLRVLLNRVEVVDRDGLGRRVVHRYRHPVSFSWSQDTRSADRADVGHFQLRKDGKVVHYVHTVLGKLEQQHLERALDEAARASAGRIGAGEAEIPATLRALRGPDTS